MTQIKYKQVIKQLTVKNKKVLCIIALVITWVQDSKYARTESSLTSPPMHKPCALNQKHYTLNTINDKIHDKFSKHKFFLVDDTF